MWKIELKGLFESFVIVIIGMWDMFWNIKDIRGY